MKYTVDYFIDKFSKIPDNFWGKGNESFYDKEVKCALGHCKVNTYDSYYPKQGLGDEMQGLAKLLNNSINEQESQTQGITVYNITNVFMINDKSSMFPQYNQVTPKERILAALYDIKVLQQVNKIEVPEELLLIEKSDYLEKQIKELV